MHATTSPAPLAARVDGRRPEPDARSSWRWRGRALVAGAVGLVLVVALSGCSSLEQTHIRDLANGFRAGNGRPSLSDDAVLDAKASAVARTIADTHTLTHSNLADGVSPGWLKLGENIGYGPTMDAVQQAYEGSPPHRANLLDGAFDRIGTGYAVGACPAGGTCVYTVQEFAQY